MRQGPLAGRYVAVAAMVMFALIPYLALSAALQPLAPIIGEQLHMSAQTLSLSSGLANAAYAVGTVLAVQFAQHLPQRRMLLGYAVLLVIGSILAAAAQNPGMFIAGRVIQGLCTSLLLIAAVPPLAIGYPANKLRDTAVIMNMCIFGAVALGPFIGGLQAEANGWRPLFWIVAGIARRGLGAGRADVRGRAAGQSRLAARPAGDRVGGRRLRRRVLRRLAAHEPPLPRSRGDRAVARWPGGDRHPGRLPVPRQAAALDDSHDADQHDARRGDRGGAVRCGRVSVGHGPYGRSAGRTLQPTSHRRPLPPGGRWCGDHSHRARPRDHQACNALPAAGRHGRFWPPGSWSSRSKVPSSQAATLVGSGLTGIGLGATVAPALFVAGFSLPSANLQRVFAIVELLRAVAAFMVAPIFVYFAANVGGSSDVGTQIALWIGFGLAVTGALVGVALYVLGGARPQAARPRSLPRGQEPGLVFPAAAGTSPPTRSPRHTSRPKAQTDMSSTTPASRDSPDPSSSPTTAQSLPNWQSSKPASSSHPAATHWSSASGNRQTSDSYPSTTDTSTPRTPARCRKPREQTAAHGAALAEKAGFRAQSMAVEAAPTWKGIVETAEERQASLIVLGSHRRSGARGAPARQRCRCRRHPLGILRARRAPAILNRDFTSGS